MKTLSKYISYLALGALVVSCADEGIADKGKTPLEGDTPYYINLQLITENSNFTRAEESSSLIDGSHDEHAISPKAHNFALFFDKDDNYISYADLYSVNEKPNETEEPDEDGNRHGHEDEPVPVEATYSCRFYGFANREPKKVLVVANANEKIYKQLTNFPGWNLEEVMEQVWEEKGRLKIEDNNGVKSYHYEDDPYDNLGFCNIDANGKIVDRVEDADGKGEITKYFTLTNSSYIEKKDGEVSLHCAEPIPAGIYTDAKGKSFSYVTTDETKVKELKPVKIYLERMVSKFDMELYFPASNYKPTELRPLDLCVYGDDGFTYYDCPWAIDILGWGLNGLETKSHIFKNVTPTGDWVDNHSGWNSVKDRRSYWSIDPHYDNEKDDAIYPWQFDEAKNIYDKDHDWYYKKFLSYDNQDEKENFALIYYPLTHFCKDIDTDGKVLEPFSYQGADLTFYTPENTFQPGMQVDLTRGTRAYELAGTHILVAARMQIANPTEGVTEPQPFDGNIYRNRVGVTYLDEVSLFEDFMKSVNDKVKSQTYLYYRYYPWNDGEMNLKNDDNYYGKTLRAESSGAFALYYFNEEKNEYHELTSSVLNELENNDKYRLYREADAINADGKVIPWVMYDADDGKGFKPLKLYFLNKSESNSEEGEVIPGTVDIKDRVFTIKKLSEENYNPDNSNDPYGEWEKITEDYDINDTQSILYEVFGAVDCYNHGLMYYAIPIYAQEFNEKPALGTVKPPYSNSPAGFDDISLAYYYGVVRNNWYQFTLHSISDLGIPVENPQKPIVPNYNNKKDQVKVEMEIIPMHIEDIIIDATQ